VPDHYGPGGHLIRFSSAGQGSFVAAAGCVVDATGPGAYFARAVGARREVDDRLFALVRLGPAAEGQATLQTLIEAVAEGWWYGARTPGDRAVVMFVTDRSGLRRFRAGGPRAFDAALTATSLVRSVASPDGVFTRAVLPVYSSALDRRAGDRWIAVGDAAASYDPIAGQGVYKALADGLAVAEQVQALIEERPGSAVDPPGRDGAVAEYRRNRAHLYRLETRFPGAPFWKTRRARAAQARVRVLET
jgi:flavin-dependent dehydrogenase